MQRNWIGKSEGAEVDFQVADMPDAAIRVYTTRPDTLFGCTYVVLAPEHPLVASLTTPDQEAAVTAYVEAAASKSDLERTETKSKTGVPTGALAVNPVSGERVPIWVADYVLGGYGTGAIMAVPGHDVRDHEFALKYHLPIVQVIAAAGDDSWDIQQEAFTETADTVVVNSESDLVSLNGMSAPDAKEKITAWLEDNGRGRKKTNYALRDWLFSRQRYWGEPFPVVFNDAGEAMPVPETDLPITLPQMDSFKPSGSIEGPLSLATDWVTTTVDGQTVRRETNTMPQWAGSCWYYLRFVDPSNVEAPIDGELEKYWLPVDMYVGGTEHAVLHLLYSRFWHKVLYDLGVVSTPEPFQRLVNQGLILGPMEHTVFRRQDGAHATARDVDMSGLTPADASTGEELTPERVGDEQLVKKGDAFVLKADPTIEVVSRCEKMSKSRGNVVNPDDIIAATGADSLRLYLMFMGPLESVKPWSTKGVEGVHRFLNRLWRKIVSPDGGCGCSEREATRDELKALHKLIKRVTEDIEGLKFNNAISASMEFLNAVYKWPDLPREVATPLVLLLSPFAPHVCEELWAVLHPSLPQHSISTAAKWPTYREDLLVEDSITVPVQVNGKLRGQLEVPAAIAGDREAVLRLLRDDARVAGVLARVEEQGQRVVKEIYVPKKIVNLVVK